MKFLRLLMSDLQRAIFSYSFLLAVLGVTLLVFSSGYVAIPQNSIMGALSEGIRGNGVEMVINSILPLLPFAVSFATEWEEHSYLFYISRIGVERYMLSKLIVSAVSGFLVLLVGVSLAVPVLKLLSPDIPMVLGEAGHGLFAAELSINHPFAAFFVFILDYALIGWLTAVCAVWFTTYVPNAFAAYVAPAMINFTLLFTPISNPQGIFKNIPILNPNYWVNCTYPFQERIPQITYELGSRTISNLILTFIMGFFAVRKAKRRILNG